MPYKNHRHTFKKASETAMGTPETDRDTASARRERLEARVTADQKQRLAEAAQLSGRSLTDFIVSAADDRAREVIREHGHMTLSPADSRAFVDALLTESAPSDKLRAAADKHRRRGGR
jgi:uncharacterized protein (DUF1778 family)